MASKTRSGKLFGTVVTRKVVEETVQVVVSPNSTELETTCESNGQRVVEVVASSTKENEKIEVISSPLKEPVRRNIVVEDKAKGAEEEKRQPAEGEQQKDEAAVPKNLEELEKAHEAVPKDQEKQQEDDQDETQPASEPEIPPTPPPKYEAPPNIEQQRDDQERQPKQEDVYVGEEEPQVEDEGVDEQELQKEDVGVGEEELQKEDERVDEQEMRQEEVEVGEEELQKEDENGDVDKGEAGLQKMDEEVDEGEKEKKDEEEEIFVSASESEITSTPTPPPESEAPTNKEQEQQRQLQQGDEGEMQPDVASAPTPPAREGAKKRKISPDIEESSNGKKRKKTADTQRRKKRAKMGSGGDTSVGYKRYVFRVMKQVHPELALSSKAMTIVNNLMSDMFERIAEEAARLSKYSGRRTLSSWEIQDAVKLVLPGELGKHAIAEGSKAVSTYASSVSGQSKKSKS